MRIHLSPGAHLYVANPQRMQQYAGFFIEAQMVNILGSEGLMISVTIIRLPMAQRQLFKVCNWICKNGCAYVAIKPYLQKHSEQSFGPRGCSSLASANSLPQR